jgi:hypothetical protein
MLNAKSASALASQNPAHRFVLVAGENTVNSTLADEKAKICYDKATLKYGNLFRSI